MFQNIPKCSKKVAGTWRYRKHIFSPFFATFHHFLSFPTNKSKFFFAKTFLNWIGNPPTQIIELLKSLKMIPYHWNETWTNFLGFEWLVVPVKMVENQRTWCRFLYLDKPFWTILNETHLIHVSKCWNLNQLIRVVC